MRLLLDTHVLLWAASESPRLSAKAKAMIDDPANEALFSVASLWEVAIKAGRGRQDFVIDAAKLRVDLLSNAYTELPIQGAHAVVTARLPPINKDPFDRLLVAQALDENITLMTSDPVVARYSPTIMQI